MPRCIFGRPTQLSESRARTTHQGNERHLHDRYAIRESVCRGQERHLGSVFNTGGTGERRTSSVIEPAARFNPAARVSERRSLGCRRGGICDAPIPSATGTGNAAETTPPRRNVHGLGGRSTVVL